MLRPILRNIQHVLISCSVLLVILALQRLQRYEFPHSAMENDYARHQQQEQQEQDQKAFDSIVKVGYNHQITLGRQFHMGLFRFFMPRLERTDLNTKAIQGWHAKSKLAYIVDIYDDLCNQEQDHHNQWLMDAALLLQFTLRKRKHLFAILHHQQQDTCNATNILRSAGYKTIFVSNITKSQNQEPTCLQQEPWLIYGTQMKVDQVVHLPLATLATRNTNNAPSSSLPSNSLNSNNERRMLTSESLHPQIHMLTPTGLSPHPYNCSIKITTQPCKSSPCPVTRLTSLTSLPVNCPFPCTTQPSNNSVGINNISSTIVSQRNISSVCAAFHKQWQTARSEWEEEQNRISTEDYCRDGAYISMYYTRSKQKGEQEEESSSAEDI